MPEQLLPAKKIQCTTLCADEDSLSETEIKAAKEAIVTLTISGEQLGFPTEANSLLEALEHNNISHEYQCRSGYCGACRCRMNKGRVIYRHKPLASLQPGEILPCCCMPLEDIELDI